MDEVYMRKNKEANTLVMISNTLPKEFPEERREEFFMHSHQFFCDFFGKENVISDWVHGDETSWHQHVKAIPTYWNEKRQKDTVSFDKVMTRAVYKRMHQDLQSYLEEKIGIAVPILNGATAGGNKTVQEMKAADLQKENERLEKEIQQQKEYIAALEKKIQSTEKKVEEVKMAVQEVQNFEGSEEANWIIRFLENVRKTLKTAREGDREDVYIKMPANVLESLEKALQPFIRVKEKVQELVNEFKDLRQLMNRASALKQNSPSEPLKRKTNRNDYER